MKYNFKIQLFDGSEICFTANYNDGLLIVDRFKTQNGFDTFQCEPVQIDGAKLESAFASLNNTFTTK